MKPIRRKTNRRVRVGSGASKSQPTGTEDPSANTVEAKVRFGKDLTPTAKAAASRIGPNNAVAADTHNIAANPATATP